MLTRRLKRLSPDSNSWWMLSLLIVVVFVLTACVLWFMDKAVQNERLAGKQRLTEAYRIHLLAAQEKLGNYWSQIGTDLDSRTKGTPLAAAFQECLAATKADGIICFDPADGRQYPDPATATAEMEKPIIADSAWYRAKRLEDYGEDLMSVASEYGQIASHTTNSILAARALQAQARCLGRSGRRTDAIQLLMDSFEKNRFGNATDARGRLIAANAELMALEWMTNPPGNQFRATLVRLKSRLTDYSNSSMPAVQRRFLMQELTALFPREAAFATLGAEELAARFLESHPTAIAAFRPGTLQLTQLPGVWVFVSPGGRAAALYQSQSLRARMRQLAAVEVLPTDVSLSVLAPDEASEMSFLSIPAAGQLLGWRLAVTLKDGGLFDTMANQRITSYLWTGVLVVTAMSILAWIIGRAFRRQIAVTRLKNDLVATVSHELKTPLASMRLLVDTLLGAERLQEQTVREYLQLIATENARLSRLIDNFLTFSRMERNRYAFDFRESRPENIAQKAAAAVQERFDAPQCTFTIEVEAGLPTILADEDGLVTALLNLLDNAFKYSGERKTISLRTRRENAKVIFEVQDNGIGLSPRDTKKVFRRFYQVDQRLSRDTGGCGLGLSIVQFIVSAHQGEIRVESELGRGSTFRLEFPCATTT
jgi:signal transduction histidine kinase